MKLKKTLYYFSICIGITSLIVFICIFIMLLFIPHILIALYEHNRLLVIIELLTCVIGLFGLVLLCVELINSGTK